jgi:PfaD family protein
LGDATFKNRLRLRYAYVVGAMANGISSVDMVQAAGRAGMLGFFGAAGLTLDQIDDAIERLQQNLGDIPFGFNLIHSPFEPGLESAIVDLYLRRGIRLVSASAYLDLTPALVYYRVKGIHQNPTGAIVCPNRIIAKVSRIEVARKFLSPPPRRILDQLVNDRLISRQEASLAQSIPMAEDLSAEADSGGHTDNQPAITLLPTMLALRDEIASEYAYAHPICIGLGGGIATPFATAAAFAMGAAYVLTGSINQSCVEAGTSKIVGQMLSEAKQADVCMAPSADMFELGVKVQVLKRGTMFPLRAAKLYDLYLNYTDFEQIPADQRQSLERDFFRRSYQEEWDQTRRYFSQRDPKQIARAEADPKHKMALVFRSYLGQASAWANAGIADRKMDYQIWCGPAMGAFNQWVKGSYLENPENRTIAAVAVNLMLGAAVVTRATWLSAQGIPAATIHAKYRPLKPSQIAVLTETECCVP